MSTRHSSLSTRGLVQPPRKHGEPFLSLPHTFLGGTKPSSDVSPQPGPAVRGARIRPSLSGVNTLALGAFLSLLFIGSLSLAFLGAARAFDFKGLLDKTAASEPGIVLLGEYVDIDIDEPSITIRWQIVACGDSYTLAGSEGVHESRCGVPDVPVDIYFDGGDSPIMKYDPVDIPAISDSGVRRSIQDLVQFDTSHELDVHRSPLYPFDTYALSISFSATNHTSKAPLSIRRLKTVDMTSNFDVRSDDADTLNGGREISLQIKRPTEARAFVMLLWIISWLLTHVSVGQVLLMLTTAESAVMDSHSLTAFAMLFVLPQLRDAMPDAPGLDGVLIDNIGYFPQMVTCGFCVFIVLFLGVRRELLRLEASSQNVEEDLEDKPESRTHCRYPSLTPPHLEAAQKTPTVRSFTQSHCRPLSVQFQLDKSDKRFVIGDDQVGNC
ncbi:hypothetical protein BV25DRAFT_1919852 [Artomyces pyxidatus]|uniref:Uncharacterized protein n=1 Tax=Artomyces pyxidatus TaxID=48021 RepID=A0ACB8SNP3_9AGAM|nr:hypothetical protein BV25DRAFT_1919852 [Artomyces pyxidatus]